MEAKVISKVFKVIASLFLVVCSFLKWLGILKEVTITEICMVSGVLYGLGAGTIDLNIFIDKFTGAKKQNG